MYAIVEIAGQQFKVEKDQRYFVHQLQGKEGEKVVFDNVLLLDDKGKISVGAPAVKGAQVTAKIEKHLKGDKVIVFKKKRRKGYAVKNGHRQRFSEISIQSITAKAVKKATVSKTKAESSVTKDSNVKAKSSTKTATAKKPSVKASTSKTTIASAEKKTAPKKTAAKKTVAKKAAPKKDDK